MRHSSLIRILSMVCVCLLAAVTAPAGQTVAKQAKTASQPVAVFAGGSISQQELDQAAGISLERLRTQMYELKVRTLKRMLFERLLQEEAKHEGKTTAQLLKENVEDKVKAPDPKRVDELLKRYQRQLGKDKKKARAKVVTALKRQEEAQLRTAYQEELFAKHGVHILLTPPRIRIPITPEDPVRGPKNAPVTIVEFSDFQCPYCGRVQPVIERLLKKYPTQVRLIFKNTPLSFHPYAKGAAEAALCAGKQGKFWEMHDWLYSHQQELGKDWMPKAVKATGVDQAKLSACIKSHVEIKKIDQDLRLSHEVGVNATPTFFIDGRMVRGAQPFATFDEIIRDELARKGKAD